MVIMLMMVRHLLHQQLERTMDLHSLLEMSLDVVLTLWKGVCSTLRMVLTWVSLFVVMVQGFNLLILLLFAMQVLLFEISQ